MDKKIDDFFNLDNGWENSTFMCERCKKEKLQLHSVILPARGANRSNIWVCYDCYCDMLKELDKFILGGKQ